MRALQSIALLAGVCLLASPANAQDLNGFEARSLQGSTGLTLPYRLFKVKNPTAGVKYPLILFLHGAGERGSDNSAQLTANAGATVWATDAHQAAHPAYVIAPQCPADKQWVDTDWTLGSYSITTVPVSAQLTTALEIADAVAQELGTDPARQYITGLSMGGYGTWDAILRNPDRFAAALPICGAGDPSQANLIKTLPLWAFHGDADPTVPVQGSRDMVTALKALGSNIQYSEYPGVGHDAWDMTYANEDVIDWLFQQKKATSSAGGGGAGGGAGEGGAAGANAGAAGTTGQGGSDSGGTGAGGNPGAAGSAVGGGMSLAGSASVAGSGSSMAGAGTNADNANADSGCSFRPSATTRAPAMGGLWLAGYAAFWLTRRRRARDGVRHPAVR